MSDTPQDEAPLDPRLQELARSYNAPPPPPRAAIWEAVRAAREAERTGRTAAPAGTSGPAAPGGADVLPLERRGPRTRRLAPWALPLAAAALLAVGIGIGRRMGRGPVGTPVAVAPAPAAGQPSPALEAAAIAHLRQAETYLTLFRASVGGPEETGALPVRTARELLASNRLLLDSPVRNDPRLAPLLEDLELVLAQIAQLGGTPGRTDLDLITSDLDHGDVLARLRGAVPAATRRPIPQGVL